MAKQETVLQVFVASPNDIADEKRAMKDIIRELNSMVGEPAGIRLELVMWEFDVAPDIAEDAQAVVNSQIPDDYDIFVGIMACRFGTPTTRAGSGTVEEYERALERLAATPGALKIMWYFKNAAIKPTELDVEQLGKVLEFKKRLADDGVLYKEFSNLDQFEQAIRLNLAKHMKTFGNDWGQGCVGPVQASRNTTESASATDEQSNGESDDELGYFDAVQAGVEALTTLAESTATITELIQSLGEDVSSTTDDLVSLSHGDFDVRAVIRINNAIAGKMNSFSDSMDIELPKYVDSYHKGLEAFQQVISLLPEFGDAASNRQAEFIQSLSSIRDHTAQNNESLSAWREVIRAMPRVTTQFAKAKRRMLGVLDRLAQANETVIALIDEIRDTMGSS